jgi:hypothetical protein
MGAKGPPRRELANSRGCVGIRGCGGYPPLRRLSAVAAGASRSASIAQWDQSNSQRCAH